MVVGDWQTITATQSPDTPVIFYVAADHPLEEGTYCDGASVAPSRMWTPQDGWLPCVTVTLVEEA